MSFVGLLVLLGIAWCVSENRRRMNWRLIASGIGLQFALAVLLLSTPLGEAGFDLAERFVHRLLSFSDAGAGFVFGDLFKPGNFATSVLPTIIFVAAATAVLFHLGIMQLVVRGMAWIMVRLMDTSGTESLAAAAEVFIGNTESPLLVRPYLETMTRSEIMAMLTAGMATVAGGVMAAYVSFGIPAGHLMTASLMAAPGALVFAKIMVPETENSMTKGTVRIHIPREDSNVIDAACRGAGEGLRLALNVAAMVLAFVALIYCVNWLLGRASAEIGLPGLSLERIFGWIFAPLAWLMGIPWDEAQTVGMLFGKKLVLNEFLAYKDLAELKEQISPRSFIMASYALCGFANFGSVAVAIGGISGLVPGRRKEFAHYALRAMIAGALTTFATASIAGILVG